MSTVEAAAWDILVDAVSASIPEARERAIPPLDSRTLSQIRDTSGRPLPKPLLFLYGHTGGLGISGYLPGHFGDAGMCMYSLIPAEEIVDWQKMMLGNHRPRGGLWPYFPHWLKALTADGHADGIWHADWIPFATDGAAGVQFLSVGLRRGVYEYSPDTFGIRRCASSLDRYLHSVARRMRSGKLSAFNVS